MNCKDEIITRYLAGETGSQISKSTGISSSRIYRILKENNTKMRTHIRVVKTCKQCGKSTKNEIFCSRTCAAIFNNKNRDHTNYTNKKQFYCEKCGIECSYRRKFCVECRKIVNTKFNTLGESMYLKHKPSTFAAIRGKARTIMQHDPQICANCGYDKHVEVGHIKAIHTYPLDTLISVINARENLILLCRNCHWELDHKLLTIGVTRN